MPVRVAVLCHCLLLVSHLRAQDPDVKQIIANSVAANERDFNAAPNFNWKERDRTPVGSKTYQVTIIEGTPYHRLIEVNDSPLSQEQQQQEIQRQKAETQRRRSESADARRERIAKYEKERTRDHSMLQQLTRAFEFQLMGTKRVRGFHVWVLKATPRPGYQPPNMDTQVLLGMQGEMWIDQKTYQWVRVQATVTHPVSIEGFLAQVEPGTQFEVEMSPVTESVWQYTRYSMRAHARVLFMLKHNSQADETYWDYQPAAQPAN
ncbi:MAG: hypothetical protein JO051_18205 [Acidobacteriaceae bacterium]|nr:hypothetical protein [Acidobacteriaceae bacterium]